MLDADRLADILGTGTVDFAVVELVRAALEAGSTDNVTVVVADVEVAGGEARCPPGRCWWAPRPSSRGGAGHTSKSFFRGHRGGDTGEIEPVPGDPDGAPTADPEELRYAPRAPHRGRWLRRLAVLLVLLLIAGVAAFLGYRWSQEQYYVAAYDGKVAIYRGVQVDVPGVSMHHVADAATSRPRRCPTSTTSRSRPASRPSRCPTRTAS